MNYWKKALITNIKVITVFILLFGVFSMTAVGKPIAKSLLFIPEVIPGITFRPLKFFTREPIFEEIQIIRNNREISASIYRPNDNKKHPVIIMPLGVFVSRDSDQVKHLAASFSRLGYVIVIPDLPDLLTSIIWTDSVDVLVSFVKYVYEEPYTDQNKIGFAGFCVGSSVAIVASEKEEIADKISFIVAVSPYYNLFSTIQAVVSHRAVNKSDSDYWRPASLSWETLARGFINFIDDENDRNILLKKHLDGINIDPSKEENLSPVANQINNLLSSRDSTRYSEESNEIPEGGKKIISELSPSTNINNLRAKLFILNDKSDTFVPNAEGRRLAKSVGANQSYYIEVDSFAHVRPEINLPRWALVEQIFNIYKYVYNVFSFIES